MSVSSKPLPGVDFGNLSSDDDKSPADVRSFLTLANSAAIAQSANRSKIAAASHANRGALMPINCHVLVRKII
jgi:hypothetical protein